MRTIEGRCHCGNISFVLSWPFDGTEIPCRACACSFCSKHGGVYTSSPQAKLEATVADSTQVSRYRFGTRTAEFWVCCRCGVVPLVTSDIDGQVYGVINVNSLEGVDPRQLPSSSRDFDGESTEARLTRRKSTWIPKVEISLLPGSAGVD